VEGFAVGGPSVNRWRQAEARPLGMPAPTEPASDETSRLKRRTKGGSVSRSRQTATTRKGEANVPDSEPRHQPGGVRGSAP
jgi:hypothetical protein